MLLSKNLAPLKAAALARIDASAGAYRLNFITDAPGQQMVYQEKREEAEKVVADYPNVSPGTVPHIAREAAMNDVDLLQMAIVVLTMAEQWRDVSASIENTRLIAKKAVADATTPAQIEAATVLPW